MQYSRLGLSALYVAIFLLSLTGLFAKVIPLDSTSITQLRGVVAAFAIATLCAFRKRPLRLARRRIYFGVYGLGVLLGIHWVTFFHAMQISTVAVGMLAMFSFPMITILLEPLFTAQGWKFSDVLAGVIMFVGLAIMILLGQDNTAGSVTYGVVWGVLSGTLFALRNLIQKYYFDHVPSDSLTFHQTVAVAVMLACFVDIPAVTSMSGIDFLMVVLLGVLSTAGGHTLLIYSLKQMPAKTVAQIACLQPVVAALLAWAVIQEVPGLGVVAGGGIVLGVSIYELRQKYSTK